VFDKFHVVSQVVKAVDEVRRKEVRVDAQAREQLNEPVGCGARSGGWTAVEENAGRNSKTSHW